MYYMTIERTNIWAIKQFSSISINLDYKHWLLSKKETVASSNNTLSEKLWYIYTGNVKAAQNESLKSFVTLNTEKKKNPQSLWLLFPNTLSSKDNLNFWR